MKKILWEKKINNLGKILSKNTCRNINKINKILILLMS